MSIAAMEWEMGNQPEDLARFASSLREAPNSRVDPARTIFTGAGDSYAAAMFAQELTKGSAVAGDPYEVSTKPGLLRDRNLVLISASGRTRANIELAKMARRTARRTIAVTANAESPLARICDDAIILQYRRAGALTSATIGFTTSLLACAHLLDRLPERLNSGPLLDGARSWARRILLPSRGLSLFVGSGVDRGLAEYGACKVQEVLGAKAFAQSPEQVGHAQLFSLDPTLDNILCIDSTGKGKLRELASAMRTSGFNVNKVPPMGEHVVVKGVAAAFCLQYLVLLSAKERRITEVAFRRDKKLLNLSNRLIY